MSRMSNLINGFVPKEQKSFVEKSNNKNNDFNDAINKLRGLIENGLIDLVNDLSDEFEKDQDCKAPIKKITKETDDSGCNMYDRKAFEDKEYEELAKAAGWSCKPTEKEIADHQNQYQKHKFESIDIIEDYGLNFNRGNALEYILNAGHVNDYVQDLKMAIRYLNREIETTYNKSKSL